MVAIAGAYGIVATTPPESGSKTTGPKTMRQVTKGLRADVQDVDVDARGSNWTRASGDSFRFHPRARQMDPSYEVMILAPYAEGTVTVGVDEDDRERRWCSMCLN